MISEFQRYIPYLIRKTKQPEYKIRELFQLICRNITIIPNTKLQTHIRTAYELVKDIDENDIHFIACRLYLNNAILWSNDKKLKQISGITVMNTQEMYELHKN